MLQHFTEVDALVVDAYETLQSRYETYIKQRVGRSETVEFSRPEHVMGAPYYGACVVQVTSKRGGLYVTMYSADDDETWELEAWSARAEYLYLAAVALETIRPDPTHDASTGLPLVP